MPSYEIRYLNSEGELALIHNTHQENDDAVDQAAFRMLVGSGLADYEIWRDDESHSPSEKRDRETNRRMLKSTIRAD